MEEVICPICDSTNQTVINIVRLSKTYECNECGNIHTIEISCPFCGSTEYVKSGTKYTRDAGTQNYRLKQRYKCKHCKRGFSDVDYSYLQIEKPCPVCGGKLRWVSKRDNRYRCSECGKQITHNVLINYEQVQKDKALTASIFCPFCGDNNSRKDGVVKSGLQRYHCKSCGKVFHDKTVENLQKEKERLDSIGNCPKCGSSNTTTRGHSEQGKRRFLCLDCHKSWTENARLVDVSKVKTKDIPLMKMYYVNLGCTLQDIADHFGYTYGQVQYVVAVDRKTKSKIDHLRALKRKSNK